MFTPEEQETRRAEAAKAAQDERDMLNLGVSNIASRFWQLDAQNGKAGATLEDAAAQLFAEKAEEEARVNRLKDLAQEECLAQQKEAEDETLREADRVVELLDNEDIDVEIPLEDAAAVGSDAAEHDIDETVTAASASASAASASASAPASPMTEGSEESKTTERDHDAEAVASAARILETEEQNIRDARVGQSFAIYKSQLAQQKSGSSSSSLSSSGQSN